MFSLGLKAQYSEQLQFYSLDYFLMNRILFKDVYANTTELMKSKVKNIKVYDDKNNLINETNVDIEGRVASIKNQVVNINTAMESYKAQYDRNNNLIELYSSLVNYKDNDYCRFTYIGSTLISYDYFLKGKELFTHCDMRHDNTKDKNLLTGYDSKLWEGDSIPYYVNFKYDIYNRLFDIRAMGDFQYIYQIQYAGDSIKIMDGNGSGYEIYVIEDNTIKQHIIYSAALSYEAKRTFHYDESGLVDYISIEDTRGNKYKHRFQYEYYH
ncbi:MAG: hypothetical protein JST55_14705 [Bacteroidetes bacterium]|nr:hypothetical protein [Bacteroidota bacterium]